MSINKGFYYRTVNKFHTFERRRLADLTLFDEATFEGFDFEFFCWVCLFLFFLRKRSKFQPNNRDFRKQDNYCFIFFLIFWAFLYRYSPSFSRSFSSSFLMTLFHLISGYFKVKLSRFFFLSFYWKRGFSIFNLCLLG